MPRSVHDCSNNVGGKLPRVRYDVHARSNSSQAPPLGTNRFDDFRLCWSCFSDSVDVLLSTRGAEIAGRGSEGVRTDNTDVPEGPGDVK